MKFCIVGTGRCGTSFLQRLFNAHPQMYVFNESHSIPTMYESFGTGVAPTQYLAQMLLDTRFVTGDCIVMNNAIEAGFNQQEFLASLNQLVKQQPSMSIVEFWGQIGQLLCSKSEKNFWADKTPDYGAYMSLLQRLWPEVKFIHLLRNGVPTATSMMGHGGYVEMVKRGRDSWASMAVGCWQPVANREKELTIFDFFSLWGRRLSRIKDESKLLLADSYYEYKYEDLLLSTKDTLTNMAAVLGLEADPQWLDHCAGQVKSDALKKLAALSYTEKVYKLKTKWLCL